jgi:deoxyuridine 5'-triphosphate nucleotidohydrolase
VKPERATPGSMGYDVVATTREEPVKDMLEVPIGEKIDHRFVSTGVYRPGFFFGKVFYGLGLAFEIPFGECAFLLPRSSINKHNMYLANSPGTIDSDYRDEVKACFYFNNTSTLYLPGERIGQLVFFPNPNVELIESDELSETDRSGGFGSTGR